MSVPPDRAARERHAPPPAPPPSGFVQLTGRGGYTTHNGPWYEKRDETGRLIRGFRVLPHHLSDGVGVTDVCMDERRAEPVEVLAHTGVGERVEGDDMVVGVVLPPVAHEVGTDESGGAGDEDCGHDLSPQYGRRAPRSARPGLLRSRADSTGSTTPQSASTAGSSHCRPSSSAAL